MAYHRTRNWAHLQKSPTPGAGLLTRTTHEVDPYRGWFLTWQKSTGTFRIEPLCPRLSPQSKQGSWRKAELWQTEGVPERNKNWCNNWYLRPLRFYHNQVVCGRATRAELEAARSIAQVQISPLNWLSTTLSS